MLWGQVFLMLYQGKQNHIIYFFRYISESSNQKKFEKRSDEISTDRLRSE